ncbi:hypothetical protein B7494_g730 [Chlorociboria aeruginascens]|nr:hypothetical protein B7494_g730 [Chlorociboria aeruginascens]
MSDDLNYSINHVFLPPKLPQRDDRGPGRDAALTKICLNALELFQRQLLTDEKPPWQRTAKMVKNFLAYTDSDGALFTDEVNKSLATMSDKDSLVFRIEAQNAGLIIRKMDDEYHFEAFELSPQTAHVMSTNGRLVRCFPGPAVAIKQDLMRDDGFRQELINFLAIMNVETQQECLPEIVRAGSTVVETRDTVHPRFITEMLTGILRGIGRSVDIDRIHKRTRDDVLWDNDYLPWRRSPTWLLLRVAIETSQREVIDARQHYKHFMIYFMSQMLQLAVQRSSSSDILYVMTAKVERRILKLDKSPGEQEWFHSVRQTLDFSRQKLEKRWEKTQQDSNTRGQLLSKLPELLPAEDIALSLESLKPYISRCGAPVASSLNIRAFNPRCQDRLSQNSTTLPPLNFLDSSNQLDSLYLSLADTEIWVHNNLHTWLPKNLASESSCIALAKLIDTYAVAAGRAYTNSPTNCSIMILTLMDMWAAFDKCATHQYEILKEYDTGFPPSLFEPLLLPTRSQMEHLDAVEKYLSHRKNQANASNPSIFENANTSRSFGPQYFQRSLEHQQLKERIEAKAGDDRAAKKEEFASKRAEYLRLVQEANGLQCTTKTVIMGKRGRKYEGTIHDPNCRKDALQHQAAAIKIHIHEWPLPSDDLAAKSVVFELSVPAIVAKWRDTTFKLLAVVFSPPPAPESSSQGRDMSKTYSLRSFEALKGFMGTPPGNIQLVSRTKPWYVTHYSGVAISDATEGGVCLNHNSSYKLFDTTNMQPAKLLLGKCDLYHICTLKLPSGSYSSLQFSLKDTTHTSNEVISKQDQCSDTLTVHEFYAFATLRSGHRLQWHSIARELVARVINFSQEETFILAIQATWQAGPASDESPLRDSHIYLQEKEFGICFLIELENALTSFESSWQGAPALQTFTALATRFLSLSPHDKVQKLCIEYLQKLRRIALGWTRDVMQMLQDATAEDTMKSLSVKVLELALTCHGTFNVGFRHFPTILSTDLARLIECSIIIHDRCPVSTQDLPSYINFSLLRYRRLTHLMESAFRAQVLADSKSIDAIIRFQWSGYEPGDAWTALPAPNERWLVTQTSNIDGRSTVSVSFNVLDGSLLINGSRLSRLPRKYESDELYLRLFRDKIIEVVPSTRAGMAFETKYAICGHQIHFGMRGSELIIQTQKGDQVSQVLPVSCIQDDFPQAFIDGYAHFLDLKTNLVEWRPLENPWMPSSQNWRTVSHLSHQYLELDPSRRLIDIKSPTAILITNILSSLDEANRIHIVFNQKEAQLEIHLPRLKLDFVMRLKCSLSERKLESKQFRGMAVGRNQSFGSMIGLVDKLVLCDATGARSVLIPHGNVVSKRSQDHMYVTVGLEWGPRHEYYQFLIDEQLGRLVDNGSLKSKLFKCYLHAVTSGCLPDPLTGRSGTEEALQGLRSASVRSLLKLDPEEITLLESIRELTPERRFYPKGSKVMQTTSWSSLPSLSQHESFQKEVDSILKQVMDLDMFQETPIKIPDRSKKEGSRELLTRAAIRNSAYRVDTFGAEDYTQQYDLEYSARDTIATSTREFQTCCASKMVESWSSNLQTHNNILGYMESWNALIDGPSSSDAVVLGFDSTWLSDPKSFLPGRWCALQKILSSDSIKQVKYKVLFLLSTLAFSPHQDQKIIETLFALSIQDLSGLTPPKHAAFDLSQGYKPTRDKLTTIFQPYIRQFHNGSTESQLPAYTNESTWVTDNRRVSTFENAQTKRIEVCIDHLLSQWPSVAAVTIAPPGIDCGSYIYVNEVTEKIQKYFESCSQNQEFKKYIGGLQGALDGIVYNEEIRLAKYTVPPSKDQYVVGKSYIGFDDLLSHIPSPVAEKEKFCPKIVQLPGTEDSHSQLRELLRRLSSKSMGAYETKYVHDLQQSADALRQDRTISCDPDVSPENLSTQLQQNLDDCRAHVITLYRQISLELKSSFSQMMCPRLSPSIILSRLAKSYQLSDEWKHLIVSYGLALTSLQRAERLVANIGNRSGLLSEIQNFGHENWDPLQYPEWLLFELENKLLIRNEQAQIAKDMISPLSGSNCIMQLNMGKGKSSVIVPIVASTLADRSKLARVIVLRSLSTQMFQLLVSKLGGMLNRRIFHMPISRSLKLGHSEACGIEKMLKECMQTGGILLVQPEHLLSFELLGLDHMLAGRSIVGKVMIDTQTWLHKHSRDILDESDEILNVKFELVYTVGLQANIQFAPDRWVIIQRVWDFVDRFAPSIAQKYPLGLEIIRSGSGQFSRVRILQLDAGDALLQKVALEICEAGLPGIPVWSFQPQARALLLRYLTELDMTEAESTPLQTTAFATDSMKLGVLLLRGLFAGGVLKFVLSQKRWRVNYGLDLKRSMLAVPFASKDIPTMRAEFSHPDTAISLSCLSYYFGGLSNEQIFASFKKLLQSDHAQEEYDRWIEKLLNLPSAFKQLTGVNLKNYFQCIDVLFPYLRFSKGMIDFYISHLVFPKEIKEFPHKISSSGWEIARQKAHPTTGFSGTNDSRYILPLTVKQCDQREAISTNAEVLDCLLRPENLCDSTHTSNLDVLNAHTLLKIAVEYEPAVRVILDVGAQVLELKNEQLAREWLNAVPDSVAEAVVFVDYKDNLSVLTRDGLIEYLSLSPYAKQMDKCLVYLDDAHTRGVDLKLPSDYRAIVSLGAGLTKDRLVQACMRMRELGKGQSIVFCGPVDVQSKIREANDKDWNENIEVIDVLSWCIQNTWGVTRKMVPLWATQGMRHYRRRAICSQSGNDISEDILEQEAQTLEERYGVQHQQSEEQILLHHAVDKRLEVYDKEVSAIRSKCVEFNISTFVNAALHEEQERELSPENEREQQIEKPPPAQALVHSLHSDVKRFISEGPFIRNSEAFQPAFEVFNNTRASPSLAINALRGNLFVTKDFMQTVEGVGDKGIICLVVSQFEANELVPLIKKTETARLHIYSPRLSLSNRTLEDLSFCAIPPVPPLTWQAPLAVQQLNLFAGQLYLQSFAEYKSLCRFLGLCSETQQEGQVAIACDGFVNPPDRKLFDKAMAEICPFKTSPLGFLNIVMSLRRRGQRFVDSHMGRLLNGDLLFEYQFRDTEKPGSSGGNESE